MRIKLANGTVLESTNEVVIEQWKKAGYAEYSGEKKTAAETKSKKADTE